MSLLFCSCFCRCHRSIVPSSEIILALSLGAEESKPDGNSSSRLALGSPRSVACTKYIIYGNTRTCVPPLVLIVIESSLFFSLLLVSSRTGISRLGRNCARRRGSWTGGQIRSLRCVQLGFVLFQAKFCLLICSCCLSSFFILLLLSSLLLFRLPWT